MLPFIRVADIQLGPLPIHSFGLLVATGVILGTSITLRRARARGLDVDSLNSFITWALVSGFIFAHWLNDLFYEPELIKKDPLRLLRFWESISSFGGFVGGVLGAFLWKYFEAVPFIRTPFGTIPKFRRRAHAAPILPWCDMVMGVFPVAWIFGRSGCSIAHDHIGAVAPAGSPIAVAAPYEDFRMLMAPYKGPPTIKFEWGPYPRYDLGLLELIFTIIICVFLVASWSRKLPTGTYCAFAALTYAPVRWVMDGFRLEANDVRYAGFTPAQWQCIGLFGAGLWVAYIAWQNSKKDIDPMDLWRRQPKPISDGVAVEPGATATTTTSS